MKSPIKASRSRRFHLRVALFLMAVLVVAAVVLSLYRREVVTPRRVLWDYEYAKSIGPKAFRTALIKNLIYPWGNSHDACLALKSGADDSMIPYLLVQLFWWRSQTKGDLMSCVQAHCIGALEAHTLADAGVEFSDWYRWWKEHPGEGRVVTYYENGAQRTVSEWRDGRRHGPATKWREDGSVEAQWRFEDGLKVEEKVFGENGRLMMHMESQFAKDRTHALHLTKWFYENGSKRMEWEEARGECLRFEMWAIDGEQLTDKGCNLEPPLHH